MFFPLELDWGIMVYPHIEGVSPPYPPRNLLKTKGNSGKGDGGLGDRGYKIKGEIRSLRGIRFTST